MVPLANRTNWNTIAAYLRTQGFTGNNNDVIKGFFTSEGIHEDTYNDAWNSYLLGLGYAEGSITDRFYNWKIGAVPSSAWILETSTWNDSGFWLDSATWSDA